METHDIERNHRDAYVMECYSGFKGETLFVEFEVPVEPPHRDRCQMFAYTSMLHFLNKFGYGKLIKENIEYSRYGTHYKDLLSKLPLTGSSNDTRFIIYKFRTVFYNKDSWKRNCRMFTSELEESILKIEFLFLSGQISRQRYEVMYEELEGGNKNANAV